MLNFETYYLISIPGFIVGVLTGRFLSGRYWQEIKRLLGGPVKLLSRLFFLSYLATILLMLALMLIYLLHLPEAQPIKLWTTSLVGVWISANFVMEIIAALDRRRQVRSVTNSG